MRRTLRLLVHLLAAIAVSACSSGPPLPLTEATSAEAPAAGQRADPDVPLVRIAFGSCSDEDEPQPLWDPILASDPGLWVWLGDNIYADTEDMSVMEAKYRRQLSQPGYAALRARVPVVGTWDDHDYGLNNGGREYPRRAASQQLLLDFLGVAEDDPRRAREGVYAAHTYGPPGRRVKVILLDVRYHRGPRGPASEILGEEQWRWLEAELRGSDAQLHLIGSGIQVLPVDHAYEKWSAFGDERDRLLRVIAESRAPGVVLLSGDRHIAEIMRLDDPRIGYPLYEVTSSGMTHSWEEASEPNRFRLGELMTQLNFGVVEIEWDAASPTVRLQVRDRENRIQLEERVRLDALAVGGSPAGVRLD